MFTDSLAGHHRAVVIRAASLPARPGPCLAYPCPGWTAFDIESLPAGAGTLYGCVGQLVALQHQAPPVKYQNKFPRIFWRWTDPFPVSEAAGSDDLACLAQLAL